MTNVPSVNGATYVDKFEFQTENANHSKTATNSTNNYSSEKTSEDEMEYVDFEADKVQLQEDWNYFKELEAALNSGDTSVIDEILSIQAGEKVEEIDENAIQYNKNTDLLLSLQAKALAMKESSSSAE